MLDWFAALFTIEHLISFLAGVGSTCAWHLIKARIQRRVVIIRWQYITVPLVLGVAAFMANQTQQNADCVREFQTALRAQSEVTAANDTISLEQRQLVYSWMHNLVFPPPQIARLPGSDPRRQDWAVDLTMETDKKFSESLDRQRRNDAYRAAHPLPAPTCGR